MPRCTHVKLTHCGQSRVEVRCKECDWRSHNWATGGKDGNVHAKESGHEVEVSKEMKYIIKPFNK